MCVHYNKVPAIKKVVDAGSQRVESSQEQRSYNEGLSKEGTENHDLVLFLSLQGGMTQTLHMVHCYTQRNPTPSALLSAL